MVSQAHKSHKTYKWPIFAGDRSRLYWRPRRNDGGFEYILSTSDQGLIRELPLRYGRGIGGADGRTLFLCRREHERDDLDLLRILQRFDLVHRELTAAEVRNWMVPDVPADAQLIARNAEGENIRQKQFPDGTTTRWVQIEAGEVGQIPESLLEPARALRGSIHDQAIWRDNAKRLFRLGVREQKKVPRAALEALAEVIDPTAPEEGAGQLVYHIRLLAQLPDWMGESPTFNDLRRFDDSFSDICGDEPDITAAMAWMAASVLSDDIGDMVDVSCRRPVPGEASMFEHRLLPAMRSTSPETNDPSHSRHRFLDLRGLDPEQAQGVVAEELEARLGKAEGARVLMLCTGDPRAGPHARIRERIARAWGIESTLRVPAFLAGTPLDSSHPGLYFVSIGEPRPEPEPAAPVAALRIHVADRPGDLFAWRTECLRTRRSLMNLFSGRDQESVRSRPYVSLSRLGQPFSQVPEHLLTGVTRSLKRLGDRLDADGGIDAHVAAAMGVSIEEVGERLLPEQVDAVGLALDAQRQGRGFLVADQTGIGKGRTLAAYARTWLRADPENRVIYFTQRRNIMPDVIRDVAATGCDAECGKPVMLTAPIDLRPGQDAALLPDRIRHAIYDSCEWPDVRAVSPSASENDPAPRMICTTYSQFARDPEDVPDWQNANWLHAVTDHRTLLVLDECHTALAPDSNIGRCIREAEARAGQVLFASGTPMKTNRGLDLYRRLLPATVRHRLDDRSLSGETAQEAFASMLAEDGVMLRRDHDYSEIEFVTVEPPADSPLSQRASTVMENIAPIITIMRDASQVVYNHVLRIRIQENREREQRAEPGGRDVVRGVRENVLMSAIGFGAPLAAISSAMLTALKVEHVANIVADEIAVGNKPMVNVNTTHGAILGRLHAAMEEDGGQRPVSLRDVLRDHAKRAFFLRRGLGDEAEVIDMREDNEQLRRLWNRVETFLEELPDDLPASPIDALRRAIEDRAGVSVEEITKRPWRVTQAGMIEPRPIPRSDIEIIDRYNSGETGVLIYNSAGSVGTSYHSDPNFANRDRRTVVQMEPSLDPVDYVQAMGRGNRYGQVQPPRFVMVSSGLVPEARLLGYLARKLRAMGALVDGDREHPLLAPDIPDLINRIGDAAASRVLQAQPGMAEQLGLSNIVAGRLHDDGDHDVGNTSQSNLVSKCLARSILLPPGEQEYLLGLLRGEFEALEMEMNAAGTNPLKVRELPGFFEPSGPPVPFYRSDDDFMEAESEHTSVFDRGLEITTGRYYTQGRLTTGEQTLRLAANAQSTMDPGATPSACAQRLRTLVPLLREFYGEGDGPDENPAWVAKRDRIERMIDFLSGVDVGTVLRRAEDDRNNAAWLGIITDFDPPQSERSADMPAAYRFDVVEPGSTGPRRMNLLALMMAAGDIRGQTFQNVLELPDPARFCREFNESAQRLRASPMQVITGNPIRLAGLPGTLDTKVGIYAVSYNTGDKVRGACLRDLKTHNLDQTPFPIRPTTWLRAVAKAREQYEESIAENPRARLQRLRADIADDNQTVKFKLGVDQNWAQTREGPGRITFRTHAAVVSKAFWGSWKKPPGRELWELLYGESLPAERPAKPPAMAMPSMPIDDSRTRRIFALMDRHPLFSNMTVEGRARTWVRENATALRPRVRIAEVPSTQPASRIVDELREQLVPLEQGMAGQGCLDDVVQVRHTVTGEAIRIAWDGEKLHAVVPRDDDLASRDPIVKSLRKARDANGYISRFAAERAVRKAASARQWDVFLANVPEGPRMEKRPAPAVPAPVAA